MAGERTDLAWSRTTLAMAVVMAAALRRVWVQFDAISARVVVLGLLASAGVVVLTGIWWSVTAGRTALEGRGAASPRALRRLTAATLAVAVVALVLAVVPYPA